MRKMRCWQNDMCRDMVMCMQKMICCDVDSHGCLLCRMCKPYGTAKMTV